MPTEIFDTFVKTINDHDLNKLYNLMYENHKFINSQGKEICSREQMKEGWSSYFQWFPDYKIEVIEIFNDDNKVAPFGYASASYLGNPDNSWRKPAAWKTEILSNKINLWQVYADTKIPYDSIKNNNT